MLLLETFFFFTESALSNTIQDIVYVRKPEEMAASEGRD